MSMAADKKLAQMSQRGFAAKSQSAVDMDELLWDKYINAPSSSFGRELTPAEKEEAQRVQRIKTANRTEPVPQDIVEQGLEGAKFKISPSLGLLPEYDIVTDIDLSKGATAFLAGAGDLIGDTARGIGQMMRQSGIAPDLIPEKQQDENEAIMRALYDNDGYGTLAMGGAVLGAVAEPVGLLIPAKKFDTAYQALMYGAVVGGLYGASGYVDPEESRIGNAIMGAATGGVLGPVMHRLFRQKVGSEVDDAITSVTERVKGTPNYKYKGVDKNGKPRLKLQPERTQKSAAAKKAAAKAKAKEEKIANVEQLEARATVRGPAVQKIVEAKNWLDKGLRPVYDVIHKLNPRVADGLKRVDRTTYDMQHKWTQELLPAKHMWSKLIPAHREAIHRALLKGGFNKGTQRVIQKIGGDELLNEFKKGKRIQDDILKMYKKLGYKIDDLPDYWTRRVKDVEGLRKYEQDMIDNALKGMRKKGMDTDMSNPETARKVEVMIERLLSHDPRFSRTASALRKRKIHQISDDQVQFYDDPMSAMYHYFSAAAEDIAKREFFRSFGYVPGKKGLDPTGADINRSIDFLVKGMAPKDKSKMVGVLQSRFAPDVMGTNSVVSTAKNLSFASTLGNYWSAVTQLADPMFAFHKYGIRDTVAAILGPKMIDKEELGISKAMHEMNSAQNWASKVADWAFTWSGFDRVDRLGKNIDINASLRHNKRMALKRPDEFKKKWGTAFSEDDLLTLMDEFKGLKFSKGEVLSDGMKQVLWNDLSRTQPIGLSNMPKAYLDMPNGRVIYTYKTFTLTQLNYMRETLMRGSRKGKDSNPISRGADLAYFAALFVAAGSGTDSLKDFMSGEREIDVEDKIIDNIWGVLGTSRYAVEKGRGLGDFAANTLVPVPMKQAYDALNAANMEITLEQIASQLPVIGKMIKEYPDEFGL